MPRAKGVCARPGCPNLQPCATHARKPWASSTRRSRLPGNWDTLRRHVLERDGHRCQHCGAPAGEVDHIIAGDDHRPAALQSLCVACHAAKTATESAEGRRSSNRRAQHPSEPHPGWVGPDPLPPPTQRTGEVCG